MNAAIIGIFLIIKSKNLTINVNFLLSNYLPYSPKLKFIKILDKKVLN